MTESEQIKEQELTIMSQQVRLARQEGRIAKLESMHRADQNHIQALMRKINSTKADDAERVFGRAGGGS